jgi:hypothetical protein
MPSGCTVGAILPQANRLEEALLAALRQGVISMPHVSVDFQGAGLVGITEITSLDAPHRVYDAILRDSSLDGKPFMKSELGIRLAEAKSLRRLSCLLRGNSRIIIQRVAARTCFSKCCKPLLRNS